MKVIPYNIDRTSISGLKIQTKLSKNGCWVWQRTLTTTGYDRINPNRPGTCRLARIIWKMLHGPIPKNKIIMHKCDNRACINPKHLMIGTQKDNIHDCIKKGRNFPPPVIYKITDKQIDEIRAIGDTKPRKWTAEKYGVSSSFIGRVIRKRERVR